MAITPEVFIDRTNIFIDKVQEYVEKTDRLIRDMSDFMRSGEVNKRNERDRSPGRDHYSPPGGRPIIPGRGKIVNAENEFVNQEDPVKEVKREIVKTNDILKDISKKESKDGGNLFGGMLGGIGSMFSNLFGNVGKLFNFGGLKKFGGILSGLIPLIASKGFWPASILAAYIASQKDIADILEDFGLDPKKAEELDIAIGKGVNAVTDFFNDMMKSFSSGNMANFWKNKVKGIINWLDEKLLVNGNPKGRKGIGDDKIYNQYSAMAEKIGAKYGIPGSTLLGLIKQESSGVYQETPITDPTSSAYGMSAKGITQIIDSTQTDIERRMGRKLDLAKPEDAIEGAAEYLRFLAKKSGKTGDEAIAWAVRQYIGAGEVDKTTGIRSVDYASNIQQYSDNFRQMYANQNTNLALNNPLGTNLPSTGRVDRNMEGLQFDEYGNLTVGSMFKKAYRDFRGSWNKKDSKGLQYKLDADGMLAPETLVRYGHDKLYDKIWGTNISAPMDSLRAIIAQNQMNTPSAPIYSDKDGKPVNLSDNTISKLGKTIANSMPKPETRPLVTKMGAAGAYE